MLMGIIVEIIFEGLTYSIGRAVVMVFLPHLRVEPIAKQKSASSWKWRGFTYKRGSHRYLYIESVQFIGLAALLLLGAAAAIMVRYAK
jgi:hypothetical protein